MLLGVLFRLFLHFAFCVFSLLLIFLFCVTYKRIACTEKKEIEVNRWTYMTSGINSTEENRFMI